MVFLSIKSLPNLLFRVLCLPGDQSHPFAQPTINPLACCICWAGLLGRAVFPPWNEGPNFGSYIVTPLAGQAPVCVGFLQARILEWVAISFFRGFFWPGVWTHVPCVCCKWILYHWATREAPGRQTPALTFQAKGKVRISWSPCFNCFLFLI